MLDELVITGYRPGDEHDILDLFHRAFGRELSMEAWRWKYDKLPGAKENIILVRDREGNLRGHYAALPLTLVYRGKHLPAALRPDMMVHPDFQRKGIGGLMIEHGRRMLAEWCSLHVAFPSPSSTPVTRKKGPHFLAEVPIYWRLTDVNAAVRVAGWRPWPAPAAAVANGLLRAACRLLELPGPSRIKPACEVKEKISTRLPPRTEFRRTGCGIYFRRDADFLRWRFDDNPDREYTFLLLDPGEGRTTPEGYAVLATMDYQGFRLGFVVDLLVDPPRLGSVRNLLVQALQRLEAQGVEAVTCMMTGRNAYTRALKSLGFVRIPSRFLPRGLNVTFHLYDPGLDRDYACDLDNWIITWADTDLV